MWLAVRINMRNYHLSIIFPWLTSAWEQLVQYKIKQRLPNALLITGAEGIGKSTFAQQFAHYVLCQKSTNQICGHCRSCQLFLAGNHPDYMLVQPEEDSNQVKIDQVRKIVQFLDQTSMSGDWQVVIVNPAEGLNRAAANSLLKTLEEPRGSVLIILVSHKPSLLPATIRSRCHQLKIAIPTKQQSLPWLQQEIGRNEAELFLDMADNLPIKALQYAKNNMSEQRQTFYQQLWLLHQKKAEPIQVVSQFQVNNYTELLLFMTILIMDLIRVKLQVNDGYISNKDKISELQEISQNWTSKYLFNYLDKVMSALQLLNNKSNVNAQLLIEQLLIYWCYKNDFS